MEFVVALGCRIEATEDGGSSAVNASSVIESHLDDVMDQLMELEAGDPSIELNGNRVEFSILLEAKNPLEGVQTASTVLRTAIHAAGGGTPDWPEPTNHHVWSVWLLSLEATEVGSRLEDANDENLVSV